jgi:branched-chain amino acid transport system ATP-binding protein
MLTVEAVTARYGPVRALEKVHLHVNEGELVGVVGANGAGKTTLMSTVMGLVKPAAGQITFLGQSITGFTPESIAAQGIALVPEGRHIFGTLTVEENLKLGLTTRRGKKSAKDFAQVFDRFPILRERQHMSARSLSGGEQQQLAIARALISQPRLLLLDEPSLGLAPRVVEMIFQVLEQLRGDGVTILLVEQNAHRTLEIADRSYVLRLGRVAIEDSRDGFATMNPSRLEDAYLGIV